jgi:hypothetical protein
MRQSGFIWQVPREKPLLVESRAAMMPQSNTAHTKAQSEPKASGVARIINTPPEYIGWRTMP